MPTPSDYLHRLAQQWPSLTIVTLIIFGTQWLDSGHYVQQALMDSSHAIVFYCACLISLKLTMPDHWRSTLTIVLVWLGFGLMIEIIQPYFGRSRSMLDLTYNTAGAGIAGCAYIARQKAENTLHVHSTKFGLVIVLVISLLLPASKAMQLHNLHRAFPVLFSFEDEREALFWHLNDEVNSEFVYSTELSDQALSLSLKSGAYPGISFRHFHSDWTGFESLNLSLSSRSNAIMVLRIHDEHHNLEYHDRFKQTLKLTQEINTISIPMINIINAPEDRRMDIKKIENIALFTMSPSEPVDIQLGQIWLN